MPRAAGAELAPKEGHMHERRIPELAIAVAGEEAEIRSGASVADASKGHVRAKGPRLAREPFFRTRRFDRVREGPEPRRLDPHPNHLRPCETWKGADAPNACDPGRLGGERGADALGEGRNARRFDVAEEREGQVQLRRACPADAGDGRAQALEVLDDRAPRRVGKLHGDEAPPAFSGR